jgi:hypothetical protein
MDIGINPDRNWGFILIGNVAKAGNALQTGGLARAAGSGLADMFGRMMQLFDVIAV